MSSVPSGRARVGWGGPLGTLMRLRLELVPSVLGYPLTDMTQVTGVSLLVTRGDGQRVETWTCAAIGTATPELAVWGHLYGPADLVDVETLTITALLQTLAGPIPSDPFQVFVEA